VDKELTSYGGTRKEPKPIQTTEKMAATLGATPKDGLDIELEGGPLAQEESFEGGHADWDWTVIPAKKGSYTLTLTIFHFSKATGKKSISKRKSVVVEVEANESDLSDVVSKSVKPWYKEFSAQLISIICVSVLGMGAVLLKRAWSRLTKQTAVTTTDRETEAKEKAEPKAKDDTPESDTPE
jgi:hypothetical protein